MGNANGTPELDVEEVELELEELELDELELDELELDVLEELEELDEPGLGIEPLEELEELELEELVLEELELELEELDDELDDDEPDPPSSTGELLSSRPVPPQLIRNRLKTPIFSKEVIFFILFFVRMKLDAWETTTNLVVVRSGFGTFWQ